jgi:hypothetical protein
MRRLFLAGLSFALTAVSACSLINAPADVIPGGAGGSASTSSQSSSGTGGTECTGPDDCTALKDACSIGVCTAGVCVKTADASREGAACDDGLFCTTTDVCVAGACVGAAKVCPETSGTTSSTGAGGGTSTTGTGSGTSTTGAGGGTSTTGTGGGTSTTGAGGGSPKPDACHLWSCNETLNACEIVAGNPGSACDDGEPCTTGETCSPSGTCGSGAATDCSALISECSSAKCTLGLGCELVPEKEGAACDATNFCATSACTAGKCALVAPQNVGLACDDKVFCTTGETCQTNGGCSSGGPTCVTTNKCQNATCDEVAKTCSFPAVPTGQPCEDGNVCSGGETCNVSAQCVGGVMPPVTYFFDDFSTSNKFWILGPEWQIGSAKASIGGQVGADPAADHTVTADNGIAGIVIGGNEQPVIHTPYFIESPSVDVAGAGKVVLTYYRWLNSDYLPFMRNMVEVYDGTSWKEVWTSAGPPSIEDSPPVGTGWTFMSHDLTAYKNMSLKVRFGYEILQGGVYTIGSWNLDDVKIQNTACPTVP